MNMKRTAGGRRSLSRGVRPRHLGALGLAIAVAAIAPSSLGAAPAGTLDAAWGGTAASNCTLAITSYGFCARAVVVLPDGKVLVGGAMRAWNGGSTASNTRLYRLNADGSVDGTFPVVTVPSAWIYAIAVNAQGDIFVGGGNVTKVSINGTETDRENVFALNADGTLKTSFNPNDVFTGGVSAVFALAPTADGGVIIGGETDTSCTTKGWCFLARLDSNGVLDTSFAGTTLGTSASKKVYAVTPAPGGGYYIGGEFTQYKGQAANYVARIKEDGSRDTTFAGAGANGFVWSIAPQGTRDVLIGGSFTTYDGQAAPGLARARTDGTIDATFSSGVNWGAKIGSNPATVFAVAVEPAGRILVGGNFDKFGLRDGGGTVTVADVGGVVGLNPDGTSDTSLTSALGDGANATSTPNCTSPTVYLACRVGTFAATPDAIFVGGTFTTFAGVSKNSVVRLANDAKSVTVTTTGKGRVTSEPAGLDCGATCTTYVRDGGTVTLTATPDTGQTFLGWGDACSGTALTCTLTLSSNQTVEARFSNTSASGGGETAAGGGTGGSGTGASTPVARAGRATVSQAGLIRVPVTTTGAGVVRITGTRTPMAVACTARRTFSTARSTTMYCVPTRATQAKRRQGPVRVRLAMRFTPTGGATASTQLATVTLPRIGKRVPAVTG